MRLITRSEKYATCWLQWLTGTLWVHQVTAVRQEYEDRIKGLMPAALRLELEDTITSLKAQVRPQHVKVNVILLSLTSSS